MKAKTVLKKTTIVLACLLCLYLFFGYVFAPKILKTITIEQTKATTGLNISFNSLSFNPLNFAVYFKGVEASDSKGTKFITVESVNANFSPSQLVFGTYHFSDIHIYKPNVKATFDKNFKLTLPSFNLNTSKQTSSEQTIDLFMDKITVEQGVAMIKSPTVEQGFKLNNLSFTLNQFNLSDIDSEFKLNISTPQNEKITLNGEYNHKQQSLTSDFTLGDIQSQTISSFLPPNLSISLTDGDINSEGKLTWPMVSLPEFELDWFKCSELSARWSENGKINQLFVGGEGINIDLNSQQIQVKNINIKNGEVNINWPWLQNETTSPPASLSNPWHYDIEQMTLSEIPIKLTDKNLAAEISQTISSASIQDLSNKPSSSDFSLLLDNPPNGTIQASGSIKTLEKPEIQAVIDIKNLILKPFSPWLENSTQFQLTNGTLSAQQQFTFKYQNWQTAGQIKLSDFQLIDKTKQDLIKVGTLGVAQSLIRSEDKRILLNQITLDRVSGFVPADTQNANLESEGSSEPTQWRVILGEIQPPE